VVFVAILSYCGRLYNILVWLRGDTVTNVVDMADHRAHLSVFDADNNAHIIPVQFFINVATGKSSIIELQEYEKIIPTIISEWLYSVGVNTGQIV
jgi:hypothetical protein